MLLWTLICIIQRQDEKKTYHLNFSKDSKFPSDIHSYKLLNRDLFSISTDLNFHIFEYILSRLAVNRYIPRIYAVPSRSLLWSCSSYGTISPVCLPSALQTDPTPGESVPASRHHAPLPRNLNTNTHDTSSYVLILKWSVCINALTSVKLLTAFRSRSSIFTRSVYSHWVQIAQILTH